MIRGRVNAEEEPEVPLVLDLGKKRVRTMGIVDTGFNGYISVPKRILQHTPPHRRRVYLIGAILRPDSIDSIDSTDPTDPIDAINAARNQRNQRH